MGSFTAKQLFSVRTQSPDTTGIRAFGLFISSVVLIAFLAVSIFIIRAQPTVTATPIAPIVAATTTPAPVVVPAPTAETATPTPTTKTPTTTIQSCVPAVANARPTAINLSTAPQGLSQVIDTPLYYQIFGNTATQIQAQLRSCAPLNSSGETFAGETAYTLTWQYSPTATSNGLCTIANVKIGLHVTMSLPAWSATAQTASGLATKWQHFISSLSLHENGHAALNSQYANQLLHDLQNYPATDCATLNASAKAMAHATLDSLNAANVAYDDHTDHGTTQGAILP